MVLLFGYNTWKSGATRFLDQIVNRLNEKSIILAGGHVESFTSLTTEQWVSSKGCGAFCPWSWESLAILYLYYNLGDGNITSETSIGIQAQIALDSS